MNPKTLQEKVEWYAMLHKQNLNGRETEDELFELGIQAGIEETEEDKDEFAIQFAEWCCAKNMGVSKFTLYKGELEQFKKEKDL